jgi:hypothetical protein
LLDGTDIAPAKTLKVEDANSKKTTILNLAYTAWFTRDATMQGFIVNSLSQEILAHVVGLETTTEVWTVITNMFTSVSRRKTNHF